MDIPYNLAQKTWDAWMKLRRAPSPVQGSADIPLCRERSSSITRGQAVRQSHNSHSTAPPAMVQPPPPPPPGANVHSGTVPPARVPHRSDRSGRTAGSETHESADSSSSQRFGQIHFAWQLRRNPTPRRRGGYGRNMRPPTNTFNVVNNFTLGSGNIARVSIPP